MRHMELTHIFIFKKLLLRKQLRFRISDNLYHISTRHRVYNLSDPFWISIYWRINIHVKWFPNGSSLNVSNAYTLYDRALKIKLFEKYWSCFFGNSVRKWYVMKIQEGTWHILTGIKTGWYNCHFWIVIAVSANNGQ